MLSCDCDFILLINSLECSLFSPGCCKSVTLLLFTGAAEKYEATEEEHEGAPVYRDSDDNFLYRHSDGTWRVGPEINYITLLKSVDTTAECPANISQWQYAPDEDGWQSGDITIKCN